MAFSRQLAFNQQQEDSLMRLPADNLRSIAMVTPYENLSNLCRSSAQYRRICQSPTFWREKARHDFPYLTEEDLSYVKDRYDYLYYYYNVINRDLERLFDLTLPVEESERRLKMNRKEIKDPRMLREVEKVYRDYRGKPEALQARLDELNALKRRVAEERVQELLKRTQHRPRVLRWGESETESAIPKEAIKVRGDRVFFVYQRDNDEIVETDITPIYHADQPVWIQQIVAHKGRMPLEDFTDLVRFSYSPLVVSGTGQPTTPKQYDLIWYQVGDITHYVHPRKDGTLEVIPVNNADLPEEAFEMFKLYNINTREDAELLYDDESTRDLFYAITGIELPNDRDEYWRSHRDDDA